MDRGLHRRVSEIVDETVAIEDILPTVDNSGVTDVAMGKSELQSYAKELLSTNPSLKFSRKRDNELWVYVSSNPYVIGYIGYGDYLEHVTGHNTYMVASRNIINGKYADYNNQHNMHTSINLKTILTKAKKAMRPINPIEIAKMEKRGIKDAFDKVLSNFSHEKDQAQRNVLDPKSVESEFRHMITTGYEFADKAFGDLVREYLEKKDAWSQSKQRKLHVHFVRAFDKYGDGVLYFEVVDIDNVQNWSADVSDEVKRYTQEDLPEDLMGKISVLNITEKDQYVDEVGYNTGDGMFYVVKQS